MDNVLYLIVPGVIEKMNLNESEGCLMCGYSNSSIGTMGAQNLPLLFLGILLSLVLMTAFIWPLVLNGFIQNIPLSLRNKPQPHDECSDTMMSHEPVREMLREQYRRNEIEL